MLRPWIALLSSCIFAGTAFAGAVNSAKNVPFAAVNSRGDSVFGGDLKLMASWQGARSDRREAGASFRFSEAEGDVFSGGIAESVSEQEPVGMLCSRKRVALFHSARSSSAPGGFWTEISTLSGLSFSEDSIACAMRDNGEYAVLLQKSGRVATSTGAMIQLPGVGSSGAYAVLASGSYFVVLAQRQAWFLRVINGAPQVSGPFASPFVTSSEQTRFAANASMVMKADSDSVETSPVVITSSNVVSLGKSQRVNVSPCGESEVCGAWLASDNSWAVSGTWGSYLGLGQRFSRLNMPILTAGSGGVAFAHSSASGRYVYLGSDDSDWGTFPPASVSPTENMSNDLHALRWMVWTKSKASVAEMTRSDFAMEWTLKRRTSQERDATNRLLAFVYRGKLPARIPKTWVAWEPEVAFAAVPWDSRQNAAEGMESWWWRGDLGLDAARSVAKGAGIVPHEVIVGVVDSGVQTDHPWLAHSFRIKSSEIPGNGVDDDGNGLVDDVLGYDFVDEDSVPEDLFGHGTHVAGLLAARDPVSDEPVGLNVNTRLVVARALNRYGKSNSIDLSRAVVYLTREGVDMMNCSWGGGSSTQALRDAFAFAAQNGVMVFSSAGNDRVDTDKSPQVPKMYPGVIPVGAYTQAGKLASFSNWGSKSVQWMAPGDKILSTLPGSQIGEKSGTSMASPIGVNVAAWIFGILETRFPDASSRSHAETLKQLMCTTADSRGVEGKSVCGRIRAVEATHAAVQTALCSADGCSNFW
jgi:hypothetical protein